MVKIWNCNGISHLVHKDKLKSNTLFFQIAEGLSDRAFCTMFDGAEVHYPSREFLLTFALVSSYSPSLPPSFLYFCSFLLLLLNPKSYTRTE